MADVEETVNIGKELGKRLRAVGIDTTEKLLATGDAKVFERLTRKFPEDACTHTRLALAGAVRGVRGARRALARAQRRDQAGSDVGLER